MSANADQAGESNVGAVPSAPARRPAASATQGGGVYLVFAGSAVERAEIDRRLGESGESGESVDAGDSDLGSRLTRRTDDPLITPIGVAWLPPERGGVRRGSVLDVIRLANPRRP